MWRFYKFYTEFTSREYIIYVNYVNIFHWLLKKWKILWRWSAVNVRILYTKKRKRAAPSYHPSSRTGWRPKNEHRSAIRHYLCVWEQLHLITELHKAMNCTVSNRPLSPVKFIKRSSRRLCLYTWLTACASGKMPGLNFTACEKEEGFCKMKKPPKFSDQTDSV